MSGKHRRSYVEMEKDEREQKKGSRKEIGERFSGEGIKAGGSSYDYADRPKAAGGGAAGFIAWVAELLQNERKRMEKERFGGKAVLWECRVRCI